MRQGLFIKSKTRLFADRNNNLITINILLAALVGFPLVVALCLAVSESGFEELLSVALKTRPKTRKPLRQATATIPAALYFVANVLTK